MKILIQRFTLRHDGEEYTPGDTVEVDDITGARLLEDARGAIVEINDVSRKKPVPTKGKELPIGGESDEKEDEEIVDDTELNSEADETPLELPSADPAQAIKSNKGGKRK